MSIKTHPLSLGDDNAIRIGHARLWVLLGFCNVAWLLGIEVDEDHRGKGEGARALLAFLDWSDMQNMVAALVVNSASDPWLARWYERLGFVEIGSDSGLGLMVRQPRPQHKTVAPSDSNAPSLGTAKEGARLGAPLRNHSPRSAAGGTIPERAEASSAAGKRDHRAGERCTSSRRPVVEFG